MKGIVDISVDTGRIKYNLVLKRKYTFIRGDSASGKTTLVDIITRYHTDVDYRNEVELILSNTKGVMTRGSMEANFYDFILSNEGYVILIDESDIRSLRLSRHGKELKESNNYFILITRESKGFIPYSIYEIYMLSSKENNSKINNYLKPIYLDTLLDSLRPDLVIVEDYKSGYEFYSNTLKCEVISSKGKTSILKVLKESVEIGAYSCIYVIADGAAFGSEIGDIVGYLQELKVNTSIYFYLPESFEYLILRTGFPYIVNIKDKIEHTYNYCEANKFNSWESYYSYLMDKEDTRYNYSKKILDKRFLDKDFVEAFYIGIPDISKNIVKDV